MLDAPARNRGGFSALSLHDQWRIALNGEAGTTGDGLPQIFKTVVHVSIPARLGVLTHDWVPLLDLPVMKTYNVL